MSEKEEGESVATLPIEIASTEESQVKKTGPVYLGIQMKPGYSLKNLLAIPLSVVIASIASAYINLEVVFLLQDEAYFNIPHNKVG